MFTATLEGVIQKARLPRINLNLVPRMRDGMGLDAAYKHGYRTGYDGVNRKGTCTLTNNGDEHKSWLRGFNDGENDRLGI
jgi:ribosome modulation factor